jgi:Mg-chelatase subunit ChlD
MKHRSEWGIQPHGGKPAMFSQNFRFHTYSIQQILQYGGVAATFCAVASLTASAAQAQTNGSAQTPRKTPLYPQNAKPSQNPNRPLLEMVFVVDTTGSMSGLIEGAKKRIWGIVNEMLTTTAEKRPEIRIGLVAYRDKGDDYVTKVLPLTNDLDKVYATLMDYQAGGGGDTPENVRRALAEGVTKMNWSPRTFAGRKVARIMFLVGDAPPHDDYQEEPDTLSTAAKAIAQGIYINTIQCGNIEGTRTVWQRISSRGEGKYFAIAQDGGVEVIPTPYDAELSRLGAKIGATSMAYGGGGFAGGAAVYQRAIVGRSNRLESKLSASAAAPASAYANADRAVNKAVNVYAYDANADLVTAIESGTTTLEKVKKEDLPISIQNLPPPEQKKQVAQKLAERKEIRSQILTLAQKRDAFLKTERQKRVVATGKPVVSFDAAVADAMKEQVSRQGIRL